MTAVQEPLWRDGWESEPCGDTADGRAFVDLHGPQPQPRPVRRLIGTRQPETVHAETVRITGEWL